MTDHGTDVDWSSLDDHDLAERVAVEAGRILVDTRERLIERGVSHWQLCDAGDMAAQNFIDDVLRSARPDDAILSEEAADSARRLNADRVWIIDPLDGTTEYGENRADWAVHVALWGKSEFIAASVALPAVDRVLSMKTPPVVPSRTSGPPRLVTSRNRAPYAAMIVADELDCAAYRLGSAGAKAMSVVLGEADIYVHDGGMHQWDSAAPAAVAHSAGLHVSRINGQPLVYNERDTWLPDFIVCRPEFKEPVLDALWGDRWRSQ